MNIRNAYDQKLESIIDRNEYILNPDEQPFKPSYLDYNYPGMRPLFPDRLSGFEKVIAQYNQQIKKKIKPLNEEECMNLLKFVFPSIYKIQINPPYDTIDFHVPVDNLYIEHKKREGMFFGYLSLEYKGCGNGYYYLLINDDNFIGYDVD